MASDLTDKMPPIAVMDATCALCARGARLLHRLDRSGEIRICPIQTARGRALLAAHGLDALAPESWLFIENGQAWRDMDALIRIGQRSGGIGRLTLLLYLIPGSLRRVIYSHVARNRYAWFGRADMCAIPDPALQARLLS